MFCFMISQQRCLYSDPVLFRYPRFLPQLAKIGYVHSKQKSIEIHQYFLLCWLLTGSSPKVHFYTPWKRPKNFGFLTFSGSIEIEHCVELKANTEEIIVVFELTFVLYPLKMSENLWFWFSDVFRGYRNGTLG